MQVLEKYFDTAFDAPDGIKKLRELILTLAMQGKLVPQDPNDQPAREFLNDVLKEKNALEKKGKIKKQKAIVAIKKDEIPFEIPTQWAWTKLGELTTFSFGKTPDSKDGTYWSSDEGVNWTSIGDMPTRGYLNNTQKFVTQKAIKDTFRNEPPVEIGTLLMSFKLSIGKTAITTIPTYHNEAIISFKYLNEHLKMYLFWVLGYLSNQGDFKSAIKGNTLNSTSLNNLPIPLPTLRQQQLIVEKINQLMALCDELEKLKQQKEAKKLTVHKSAISQLLDSKDEGNSQNGWRFISEHFNDLYTAKENVSELRSAILQLAMQGKLVPQDPNDKPASELLKEIEKEKKANKVKSLEAIKSESIPYNLPNGWQWVYLNDFGVWKSGSTPSRTNSVYYDGDIPWVKSGEVKQGLIKKTEETITQKALDECSLGLNPVGSVLVAMYGANIGEVGILEVEATTNQAICACQTFSKINNQFLKFLIDSLKGYFISQGAGAAQPNISRVKIINTIAPLPPYNEQKRIVDKINQLMALCDDLEKQIENSSIKQTELLNAIMSNLGK